jgi:hypothetical protein
MDTGSALGGTGLAISMIGIIYSAINHKHIKSRCCGKELEVSIDIDTIQPGTVTGLSKNRVVDLTRTVVEALPTVVSISPSSAAAPLQKVVPVVSQAKVKPVVK